MGYSLSGKSGTVRIEDSGTVTNQQKKHSGKVTSYPIETGSKISDHVEREPSTGTLSGIVIGGGAVATLESMLQGGEILTYSGSYRMDNVVLTALDFSTDSSNRTGFSFSASFQRVEIVGSQYVPTGETPLMSQQDAGKSSAAAASGKPASDGLQTKAQEPISTNAYQNYVNTFNNKPPPSAGPNSRAVPSYSGYGG